MLFQRGLGPPQQTQNCKKLRTRKTDRPIHRGQLVRLGLPSLKSLPPLAQTESGAVDGFMDTGKVLIFFGPPGSGKGTQASRFSAALRIPAISTGEILRHESQSGSDLGRAVTAVLASGQLVGDDLMNQVVTRRLQDPDCAGGCILDGYPRTLAQAHTLDHLLAALGMPEQTIVDFSISARDVVARLDRRRQCAHCGRICSIETGRRGQLVCEVDGAPLIKRADDHPAAIRERLRMYKRNAAELIRFYRTRGYHRIRANRTPDEVSRQIFSALDLDWGAPMARNGRAAFATRAAY